MKYLVNTVANLKLNKKLFSLSGCGAMEQGKLGRRVDSPPAIRVNVIVVEPGIPVRKRAKEDGVLITVDWDGEG